ncbi:MAG: hypothetical protein AB1345_09430 [Chloroflexota bacterium]
MSRYGHYYKPPLRDDKGGIHPIWRGLGCLLGVIVPIISYFLADFLVQKNWIYGWVLVPNHFIGPYHNPNLYLNIGLTVILTVLIFTILTILYMFIYRLFGPPQYTLLDVPPPRRRRRKS